MADQDSVVTLDDDPEDISKPVTIKLDGDAPVEQKTAPEKKPSLAQTAAAKVKERDAEIAAAKAEAARQAQRADNEARLRMHADNRASQVESVSRTTQVTALTNAIEACKSERTSLRRALADAYSAGDHNLAAEISDKIADIAAKQSNLEAGKFEAERVAKQLPTIQRDLPSDPVERFIAERNLNPASANWLRANPRAVRFPGRLSDAHTEAINAGHQQETPAYFAEVEKIMGLSRDDDHASIDRNDDRRTEREPPQQRRGWAAPPSSSADRSIGRTPDGGYIMTPEMREMARISGVTDKEWMKSYLKIQDRVAHGESTDKMWLQSRE